jgi:hypothetical protein
VHTYKAAHTAPILTTKHPRRYHGLQPTPNLVQITVHSKGFDQVTNRPTSFPAL